MSKPLTRRMLLQHAGRAAAVAAVAPTAGDLTSSRVAASPQQASGFGTPHPKIAVVLTEFRYHSHAQVITDRFLQGYPIRGQHHTAACEVVAMYTDQVPDNDLSRERAHRYGFTIYPTIAATLCRGGDRLAVDGVVIIGEHGNYPLNERGQKMYPRHRLFSEVVAVFERSGRCVPVFSDKHLSYDWTLARWMVDRSRALGFPFFAGSSVPVTWRLPALEYPLGVKLEEVLSIGYDPVESYDFHALEGLQCMAERRGESGVRAVQAYGGAQFWDAMRREVWSMDLFRAALARSHTKKSLWEGYSYTLDTVDAMQAAIPKPEAYVIEYRDGLRGTMLRLGGYLQDFNFAGRTGDGGIQSTNFHLLSGESVNHFAYLTAHIERMMVTGQPPYPVERTLLTTGILAAAMESRYRGYTRVETPEFEVTYTPAAESTFMNA